MGWRAAGLVSAVGVVVALDGASLIGQSRADSVEAHLAEAATAGLEHIGLFTDLCAPDYLQNGFMRNVTYLTNGRQYIVVAVGARGVPSELVALTVP